MLLGKNRRLHWTYHLNSQTQHRWAGPCPTTPLQLCQKTQTPPKSLQSHASRTAFNCDNRKGDITSLLPGEEARWVPAHRLFRQTLLRNAGPQKQSVQAACCRRGPAGPLRNVTLEIGTGSYLVWWDDHGMRRL